MNDLDHNAVLALLPDRDIDAHKGDFGKILLICGSVGYTGAAYLSAMGALRAGAGLVYLAVPRSIYPIVAVKLTEPIIIPLPDKNGKLSAEALPEIKELLPKMDAVLMGCGLGQSEDTQQIVSAVLQAAACPVVLDADGINVMSAHKDILRGRNHPTIITPHMGEFNRFGGVISDERIQSAKFYARSWNCILVLKGHNTCITDGHSHYVNHTGNPGMAVGGSGDLLAGVITGLIGQRISPLEAAACGVWLHGAAGDLCAEEQGQYSMLPTDMLDFLPRLMK